MPAHPEHQTTAPSLPNILQAIRAAMQDNLVSNSESAQNLALQFIQTGNASWMDGSLHRMEVAHGIDLQQLGDWLGTALIHTKMRVFARYLDTQQCSALCQRLLQSRTEWSALFSAVRQHIQQGGKPDDAHSLSLAEEWHALFLRSYANGDSALENKLRDIFPQEPVLMCGLGLDQSTLMFAQAALMCWYQNLHATELPDVPKPSALMVAVLRAAHQHMDTPPLFVDPLATAIIGKQAEAIMLERLPLYRNPVTTALRTALVIRSRLAEDYWHTAHAKGIEQYVLLGAGLDTHAYRHPQARYAVFEVDLPEMQTWKRKLLAEAKITEPPTLRFVSIDFEREDLLSKLDQAGFDRNRPAFFAWLGVVMYLEPSAVQANLQQLGTLAQDSEILFDYALADESLAPMERVAQQMIRQRLAAKGEPWKSAYTTDQLAAVLHDCGFAQCTNHSGKTLSERYLKGRNDDLRLRGGTNIMHAVVREEKER